MLILRPIPCLSLAINKTTQSIEKCIFVLKILSIWYVIYLWCHCALGVYGSVSSYSYHCVLVLTSQVARLENAIGWYHSHPGYGCWLSGIDVSTQMLNQQFQEPFVAIVVSIQVKILCSELCCYFRTDVSLNETSCTWWEQWSRECRLYSIV